MVDERINKKLDKQKKELEIMIEGIKQITPVAASPVSPQKPNQQSGRFYETNRTRSPGINQSSPTSRPKPQSIDRPTLSTYVKK